jgi:protein O-GlcNAc transferase
MTIQEAFELALQRHRVGRLADAEGIYRQILAAQPNHVEALHMLGVIAHQMGRNDLAIGWIQRAILLDPHKPLAHSNLGEAFRALGRLDEAIASYRRALNIEPGLECAHCNLGNALGQRGDIEGAIGAFRRALELKPKYAEAHNNLGLALRQRGQLEDAVHAFRCAVHFKPDFSDAHNNLGVALCDRGLIGEAIGSYRRAIQLRPGYPEAHNNLGVALRETGQLEEAMAAYRRAIQLRPDYAEAYNNLGVALRRCGQLDEAIVAFRNALQFRPDHPGIHSNLVFELQFHPGSDASTISDEQQRWNLRFGDPVKPLIQPHTNDRSPNRRLRVGYVSPDFRDHAVGRFALPLLERHDAGQFDVFCYSELARPDWMTDRFRALAGGWRDTVRVPDARLAEMIREDGVDILVDLAMHTEGNRLSVFAREPAPVQVTWLAYPGGTGLHSIGFRFTDAFMDPPGTAQTRSENPLRLPNCWCCYDPVDETPEVNDLPALSAEAVTFGSLNNYAKVNNGALALWARVLEAVERSRLLMLCPEGSARQRVLAFFGDRGIATNRLELVGQSQRSDYLKLYQRIDLALDPFPHNGMTTTCDALWMGVPVLTLPGEMPSSRAGLSLLSNVGLPELAAPSQEDYVQKAVELAANLPRLAELRSTLRSRMLASPLTDAPRFAGDVEAAYRTIWRAWCSEQPRVVTK